MRRSDYGCLHHFASVDQCRVGLLKKGKVSARTRPLAFSFTTNEGGEANGNQMTEFDGSLDCLKRPARTKPSDLMS